MEQEKSLVLENFLKFTRDYLFIFELVFFITATQTYSKLIIADLFSSAITEIRKVRQSSRIAFGSVLVGRSPPMNRPLLRPLDTREIQVSFPDIISK